MKASTVFGNFTAPLRASEVQDMLRSVASRDERMDETQQFWLCPVCASKLPIKFEHCCACLGPADGKSA